MHVTRLARVLRSCPFRFALLAGPGGLVAFAIMAADRSFRWGVAIGTAGVVAAACGLLVLVGGFEAPDANVARSTPFTALRRPLADTGGALVGAFGAAWLATTGRIGRPWAGALVTATFVALVVT